MKKTGSNSESITLHHADAKAYSTQPSYFGASVGRVANRIKNGAFSLEGTFFFFFFFSTINFILFISLCEHKLRPKLST